METRNKEKAGFTLIEVMIVVTIMFILCMLFYQVTMHTTDAMEYAMAFNDLATATQKASNSIKEDLVTAKEEFQNNDRGIGYWNTLQFSALSPPIDTSTLPTIDPNGVFCSDTVAPGKTGNCLLFIKTDTAYEAETQYGPDDDNDVRTLRVDVYRIVAYYLSRIPGADIGDVPDSLDLIRCESQRFLDKAQVEAMAGRDPIPSPPGADAAQRAATLPEMQSEFIKHAIEDGGLEYCWDTTAPFENAFFALVAESGDEFKIADEPTILTVDMGNVRHVIPNLPAKHSSVSWNTFHVGTRLKSRAKVPQFGLWSLEGDWFPNGFEIQIVGQSGSRQVLVRLVLAKETSMRRIAAHDARTIISTRDF